MKKYPYCESLNADSNIYCKHCGKEFSIARESNAFSFERQL
jgi:hypothetical protein